jgi:hypothetical protein
MYPYLGINSQSSATVITATGQELQWQPTEFSDQSRATGLHTEIRAVLELYEAHSQKIYFSGPLVHNLFKQTVIDEGWVKIWAQLGGSCLSIWVVREIEAASKEGREVPPSYTNITDSVSFTWIYEVSLRCLFTVYTNYRSSGYPCDVFVSSETILKRNVTNHCRIRPQPILVP